jgi:hypothetical protein
VNIRTAITPRGRAEQAEFHLQLCLTPGEALETGAGRKITVGAEPLELSAEEMGGWIRHHGWTLRVDAPARLKWPVYPFNPYANGPEKGLAHAVGLFTVPLRQGAQEFGVSIEAN